MFRIGHGLSLPAPSQIVPLENIKDPSHPRSSGRWRNGVHELPQAPPDQKAERQRWGAAGVIEQHILLRFKF